MVPAICMVGRTKLGELGGWTSGRAEPLQTYKCSIRPSKIRSSGEEHTGLVKVVGGAPECLGMASAGYKHKVKRAGDGG